MEIAKNAFRYFREIRETLEEQQTRSITLETTGHVTWQVLRTLKMASTRWNSLVSSSCAIERRLCWNVITQAYTQYIPKLSIFAIGPTKGVLARLQTRNSWIFNHTFHRNQNSSPFHVFRYLRFLGSREATKICACGRPGFGRSFFPFCVLVNPSVRKWMTSCGGFLWTNE